LPTASIEFGDREGRQCEVVGEKDQRLVGLGILEPNASQRRVEALVGVEAREDDGLIAENDWTLHSPRYRVTHRRNVVSGRCCINCAKTSLPWFIDHLCEVVPRRVAEPAFAVQIETKIIHYLRVSNQQLTDTPSPNVGTLLVVLHGRMSPEVC
jgi:hypothetical protein